MCAIVPVPDGCSWDPRSLGKLGMALREVPTLIIKSSIHSMQEIKRYGVYKMRYMLEERKKREWPMHASST